MQAIDIGTIALIPEGDYLRVLIIDQCESTWSLYGAQVAVSYLQAWIAEQGGIDLEEERA